MGIAQLINIDTKTGGRIIFPANLLDTVYEHCRRKLAGNYLDQESPERKAFGLIAGIQASENLAVRRCFPLMKNARQLEPYNKFMDTMMTQHGVPSETPFSKRGWIADPEELLTRVREMQREGLLLLGAYHMHRVAWPNDPLRDTPTKLDTILGAGSSMLIFIISMVRADQPIIRAFYEGRPDMEMPVVIEYGA